MDRIMDTIHTFRDAIRAYYQRGWMTIPLINDAQGLPKRPCTDGWQSLKRTVPVIERLPWQQAKGLGIPLGPVSGNLAVLDLDDVELTNEVFARLVRAHVSTRLVFSARKRGHVYMVEAEPSRSTVQRIRYKGREVKVELKAQGTQVAAPPTPNYLVALDRPPMAVPSIRDAWDSIVRQLGVEVVSAGGGAGYPKPWQPAVKEGERNQTAYVEAHKLREAGMSLEQALDIMRIRWEQVYDKGKQGWAELERTVHSAYHKAQGPPVWEAYAA